MHRLPMLFWTILFLTAFVACQNSRCERIEPVGFWDMGAILNQVYACNYGVRACGNDGLSDVQVVHGIGEQEEFQIWTKQTNNIGAEQFNISDQDGLLAQAVQLAKDYAPVCTESSDPKVVQHIAFWVEGFSAVPPDPPGFAIGMDVTYMCCEGELPR